MLPGLHIFDLYDLAQCEILSDIKIDFENGKVRPTSEYHSNKCNAECNDHHLIVYLENVLHKEHPTDHKDILEWLSHRNSKVRKIALILYYQRFPNSQLSHFLQKDPSYSVREIYLKNNKDLRISTLIKQTKDENQSVKIQALARLAEHLDDLKFGMDILRSLCRAMNDRILSVRVYASKVIGGFRNLPDDVIERLLNKQTAGRNDKEISGALVYGIEDECLEVRKNTVRSLYSLTTPGVVSKAFDFLVDSLNDDDESLRELCTHYLKRLSERHVLSVEQEIINQICGSLEEKSFTLRENVLDLLCNLRYEDLEIFNILVFQMNKNVEPRKAFNCIRKIVSRNKKLFFSNIRQFYEHKSIAQVESLLSDCHYVARLVVLKELRLRGFKFKLSRVIEDHFLFLDIMDSKKSNASCDLGNEFFKDILLQFLEEKKSGMETEEHYRKIFSGRGKHEDNGYRFICYFYNSVVEWLDNRQDRFLRRISHIFANTNFSISIINEMDNIIRYIRDLHLEHIKPLKYRIDVQSSITVGIGMPIKFQICVFSEESSPDLSIKVGSRSKPCLYFPMREKMDVCILEDDISVIYCCIVKLLSNDEIQVSDTKTVMINRK